MVRMSTKLLKRKIAELQEEIDGGENTPLTVADLERQKRRLQLALKRHEPLLSTTGKIS